jgi:hypothetical protein
MAEPTDIIQAIEDYLEKSGKGKNYLANKINELMEGPKSPISLKGKYMINLSYALEAATKKLLQFDLSEITSAARLFSHKLSTIMPSQPYVAPVYNPTDVTSPIDEALHHLNNFISEFRYEILGKFFDNLENANNIFMDMKNSMRSVPNEPSQPYVAPVYNPTDVTSPIDEALHHLTNFMSEFRYEILGKFFDNLENANNIFMDMKNSMRSIPNEDTLNNDRVMNVNVMSLSSGVVASIVAGFMTASSRGGRNNDSFLDELVRRLDARPKEEESGGIIGTILKGIVGVTALFAGIGFISEFLNNTPMGKMIKEKLGDLKEAAMPIINTFIEKFKEYALIGLGVLWDTVKEQFTNFQFFGLKDMLGKENEGLAVLLAKGIYYAVSGTFTSILNKFSFGGFSKVTDFLLKGLGKLGEMFSKWGGKLLPSFTEAGKWIPSTGKAITDIFYKITSFGGSMLKFFTGGSGIFGKLGSVIGGSSKLLGGGIFKILGKGLSQIAKRIPFIGALISFKDAYDRFQGGDYTGGLISIGSGIASFFPFLGTAVSIGLDVLNAFLDSASDGGQKSKLGVIGDFLGSLVDKVVTGIKTFFSGLLEGLYNSVIDAGKTVLDKTGISWLGDKIASGYNYVTGNEEPPAPIQVNDASIMARQTASPTVIQPSNKDQIIAMQSGGPFDMALKDMTTKLNMLIEVFTEGVQLIASANMQGSSNIVQAVVATGKSGAPTSSSSMGSSRDPIGEYRQRAQRAIDYSSR